MICRTVPVDGVAKFGTVDDADPARIPDGLEFWEPENGSEIIIHPR